MSGESSKLQPAVNVMNQRAEEASQEMTRTQASVNEEQQQLAQIDRYILEYQRDYLKSAKQGMTGFQLQVRQHFIDRLKHAKHKQQSKFQQQQVVLTHKKQHWQEQFIRAKAISIAADKLKSKEAGEQNKKEQREMDEITRKRNI